MSLISSVFTAVIYQPLFNALVFLYNIIPGHDFGIAIILLTILIKFLFYPLGKKAIQSQKALSELQPKVKELQEKYKDDKEKQAKEVMDLYKKEKVNPFSGIIALLIQLPVLIALYRVFWKGLDPEHMGLLYVFIGAPETINTMFLGMMDIAAPSLILAVLAGIFQFYQVKMMTVKTKDDKKKSDFSRVMQTQMQYFLPVFTVIILTKMPAAVGLYWITTTVFTIVQQYFSVKQQKHGEQ